VRKRLVQSLVTPHINYGNIVYSSVDVASRSRIRAAFKACLRYIHKVRPRDHISHLENSVTGKSLERSAGAQLLTFLYKILHVRDPSYIFSLFHFASSARTRNLVVPLHRSHAMSFIVRSAVLWNSLSNSVKALSSLGRFTQRKTPLFFNNFNY
jgi:hypothetical protein